MTENFRPILLLLLAALLIFLYLWLSRPPAKDPVPTFRVSAGSIIVTPDESLGADLVKITAFGRAANGQDSLLASGELAAPFAAPFPINFDKSVESVRVKMDYSKSGQRIGCPPFDETIIVPPVGVPIIAQDVPVTRSTHSQFSATTDWCDCNFGAVLTAHPCTPPTTHFQYSIGAGAGSIGQYRVVVTKSTTAGGPASTATSRFMLSISAPSGIMTVQYYTDSHMTCTGASTTANSTEPLDIDTNFSLQAFNKAVFYNNTANTAAPKYTCHVQKLMDCPGSLESDRAIVVKCDDTPPPSGTSVSYSVSVMKAVGVCGDGSF